MAKTQPCTAEQLLPTQVDGRSYNTTNPQRREMGNGFSDDDSLDALIDLALVLSRATGAALAVIERDSVVCHAASGTLAGDVGLHIDERSGLLGMCIRTAGVVSCNDVDIDGRVNRVAADQLGTRSALAVPVCTDGRVIGVLEAVSSELSTFDKRAINNLKELAEVIACRLRSSRPKEGLSIAESQPRQVGGMFSTATLPLLASVPDKRPPVPDAPEARVKTARARSSISKLGVAAAVSLLVLASAALFLRQPAKSKRPGSPAAAAGSAAVRVEKSNSAEIPKLTSAQSAQAGRLSGPSENGGLAQVMAICFSSHQSFTEVTVGLSARVRYDAHHFRNPERIYFDLHSTSLAPALGPWGKTFRMKDNFLLDVRVAQHAAGLTRVVLDAKDTLHWSTILAANPPGLIIRVGHHQQDVERQLPPIRLPQISWNPPGGSMHRAKSIVARTVQETIRSRKLSSPVKAPASVREKTGLRAIYLTGAMAGSPRGWELIETWRRMGGNAIVFDIKSNTGTVNIPFEHPLNNGPLPAPIDNLSRFVAHLHSSGMYAIGRISVFRDVRLVTQHPELAVRSRRSGQPWKENGEIAWADPSNAMVQQYNINLAKAAAAAGLDEVQFDYTRFPVQGNQKDARFEIDSKRTGWRRSDVITHFVAAAYSQLHPIRVLLSLDVFGVLAWDRRVDIASTGQDIRALVPYCDVISPMIYPSHFFGMDGYAYPGDAPQHFISQAMKRFSKITANTGVLLRPWLQGFSWHTSTYSTNYVLTQIETALANGATGFLFWNAENEYREPLAALLEMRLTEIEHKGK